ncbi:MAG: UvrD-helicase domain-containing protein, partial [Calditrichaeota bacterium]|nr:UvrD-helicase domain-containing protein [Calditrichota bacterium]
MKLTDQQMAIVQHTTGPALVFAVAGSGKTTSMVQRIKHLVERRVVPAEQILATSFNNSAVRDIVAQLKTAGVKGKVNCRTLHALGYHVVYLA